MNLAIMIIHPYDCWNLGTKVSPIVNRTQIKIGSEIGYDVTENFKPFIRGRYNYCNYQTSGERIRWVYC